MSTEKWNSIKDDERKPMLARYLQSYCPGSTFKPITGAIGLTTNTLSKDDTFNYSGLSWQKDKSWGSDYITTLTAYSGTKNIKNALIHSDNIFFGQAAMQIGRKTFCENFGMLAKYPFWVKGIDSISKSQFFSKTSFLSLSKLTVIAFCEGLSRDLKNSSA